MMLAPTKKRIRFNKDNLWIILAALIPIALVALPLIYVTLRTAQTGISGAYAELFRLRNLELLINTITLATGVTVLAALIGLSIAWCIERTDIVGKKFWRVAASLPLAMPAFVASYSWASIDVAFQNMAGAILILALAKYPLVYLPVAASLRGTDSSFEDVARSLGHGPWNTFRKALLPQLIPALGGGALLVVTHMFAEFGALALLRVQTFTTAIFETYELQFDSASAAMQSIVLMMLCLPVVWLEIRIRAGKRVARVGRGSARQPNLVRLGKMTPVVLVLFFILGLLSLGVPLSMLVYWLITGHSAGNGYAMLWPAVWGSLSLAGSGAILTSIIAIPLVMLSVKHKGRLAQIAERLPYIVHGLPGVVVALALVYISIRLVPFVYQSVFVLLAAYAILFLPLAQSSLRGSIVLVPTQIEPIARSLGRKPFHVFITVILPNIAPGVGAALSLMMLEMVRELTATLMLAPTGTVTLATEVWSYTSDAEYAAAAPFAALLVMLSILPVWVFTRRMLHQGN